MDIIVDFLLKKIDFSQEELKVILSKFDKQTISKNELFLKEGEVCKKVAFIKTGTFILSQTNDKGNEHVLDFFVSGDMISDYYSFLKQIPSDTKIKALIKSELLVITKKDLDLLFETIPNYQKLGRLLAEEYFMQLAEKIKTSSLPPIDRYKRLIKQKPFIIEKFPQYMIASCLGVSPEWLSKIRAQK